MTTQNIKNRARLPETLRSTMLATQTQTTNKKAVLPQGNRAMPQVFFSVEVRQQLSLQV